MYDLSLRINIINYIIMTHIDRKTQIKDFLKTIKTQKEWNTDKKIYVENMIKRYETELEDYMYVGNVNEYDNIKLGGYIRYIDMDDNIHWGGILLKKIKTNDIDYMILCNSSMYRFKIAFYRNTIFYKKHTTSSDKTRKLFISYLDKIDV